MTELVITCNGIEERSVKKIYTYPQFLKQRIVDTVGFTSTEIVKDLSVNINSQGFMWAFKKKELVLHTYWNLGKFPDGDFLYPTFTSADHSVLQKNVWKVPEWLVLFACGNWETSYLTAKYKDKLYQLPLPNIYDDSRLCLGSGWNQGKTITTIKEKVNERLDATQWNTDLYHSWKAAAADLFAFSPSGEQRDIAQQKAENFDSYIESKLQPCQNSRLLWLTQ
ncbi:MAG: hypothetical protein KGZ30_01410 [Anaplasmataceae bacterium]|nr:hypothetical protein [Anaplasmataceae bacterium]